MCWDSAFEDEIDFFTAETVKVSAEAELSCREEILLTLPSTQKQIKQLLKPYGLCMPTERLWNNEPGAEFHDFNSLSPISLPLRRANSATFPNLQAEDHDYEYTSSHAVADISLAVFALPPDIHRRFASLVKTCGLDVEDRATVEILPAHLSRSKAMSHDNQPEGSKTGRAGSAKGKVEETKDKRELKFVRVEPRWMPWSTGEPCA